MKRGACPPCQSLWFVVRPYSPKTCSFCGKPTWHSWDKTEAFVSAPSLSRTFCISENINENTLCCFMSACTLPGVLFYWLHWSVVSVIHWAFLRGLSLCHIHSLIHTYLFRYHRLRGKLMPDYSPSRTLAQRPAAFMLLSHWFEMHLAATQPHHPAA